MKTELFSLLMVMAYLILGTAAIAALMSWAIRRFGWPPSGGRDPEAGPHSGHGANHQITPRRIL